MQAEPVVPAGWVAPHIPTESCAYFSLLLAPENHAKPARRLSDRQTRGQPNPQDRLRAQRTKAQRPALRGSIRGDYCVARWIEIRRPLHLRWCRRRHGSGRCKRPDDRGGDVLRQMTVSLIVHMEIVG